MHVTNKTGLISRQQDVVNAAEAKPEVLIKDDEHYQPEPVKPAKVIFVKKIDPRHKW